MTIASVRHLLRQAKRVESIEWVYFEGGEPFLHYPLLVEAVAEARAMGFRVGVVSNGFWARDKRRAMARLAPLAGLVDDLSISSDSFHCPSGTCPGPASARSAAEELEIPSIALSVHPLTDTVRGAGGNGGYPVLYRGRAAEKLAERCSLRPWSDFDSCVNEDLVDPGRVHVDPFGNMYVCQGICLGNLFRISLKGLLDSCSLETSPVIGPLVSGGPAELVRAYELSHEQAYADSCHLCYVARRSLRSRFPGILTPDQAYGVVRLSTG